MKVSALRKVIGTVVALVWAGASAPTPALANDSTAELAAGGLVLTKTSDIEMRSEDLSISRERVVVKYQFYNTSAQDISTVIAFPLPDITIEQDQDVAIPAAGTDNFLNFKTLVDGKPVKMTLEQKVLARGVDQTELLKKLKLPLSPLVAAEALDRLDAKDKQELIGLGLAEAQDVDFGQGMKHHLAPLWTLKTTYYWTQVFPAKTAVSVEHEYSPSVGGSVGTSLNQPSMDEETRDYYKTRYCTDPGLIAAARANKANLGEDWISYVLKTGANWAKAIGNFTLTVDKGAPENLVSFCGDGVEKISPTKFRMTKRDFTPTDDLHILILKPRQQD
jgi:hypothetical protein